MPKFNSKDNTIRDLDSMLNGVFQAARGKDWTASNETDANGVRTLTVVLTPRVEQAAPTPPTQERNDGIATTEEGVHDEGED